MLSFKSVIEKKSDNIGNIYKCNTCDKIKNNKAWAIYYNECKKCDVNVCSYLCYNKEIIENKNVWENIKNKEDFNMLYPIIKKKEKDFVIKSENEIYNMNTSQRDKYYSDLDCFYDKDPMRAVLLNNIQKIMDNQEKIEEYYECSSNSEKDYNSDDY